MKNKTVLITGAAKNIGKAIAKELHNKGMDIIIHYNKSEREALNLAKTLNNIRCDSATIIQADLKKQECYSTLVKEALSFKGRIDVLVNNASAFYATALNDINEKYWNELINLNLKAPLFISKLAAKSLEENNGCIINITDIHAPGAITWPNEINNEAKKEIINQTFLKKMGNTEDIAKTVIFLIEDANYITGQILNIDGGKTLFL